MSADTTPVFTLAPGERAGFILTTHGPVRVSPDSPSADFVVESAER